ncbi:MAG: membrane integrity-associated transporter subunit PqiC [Burkholderiales bacterium]|nr:membrane integrity-associated transporter subunit PqiC [Burkholderiales bacterium]
MNVFKPWFAAALAATLLAACAVSPSPAPVLLTLPPAAAPVAGNATPPNVPGATGTPPLLAVRRVKIPEYLVARRVRYRTDASTLAEWPNTYWAERIEVGVSREFVAALRQQLPGWTLCDTHCGDQLPALTLQVDLEPLDYLRSARQLQAQARLTLSGAGAAPKLLATQAQAYEIASDADTPQAQAQAMADLIRKVAAASAALIRTTKP